MYTAIRRHADGTPTPKEANKKDETKEKVVSMAQALLIFLLNFSVPL